MEIWEFFCIFLIINNIPYKIRFISCILYVENILYQDIRLSDELRR